MILSNESIYLKDV